MKLTKDFLDSILFYDEDTGIFTWKRTIGKRAIEGKTAGSINKKGHVIIVIKGKSYRAHRLAFLLKGVDVPNEIDHIDRIKTNNKWSNLRPGTPTINAQNRDRFKNKTGQSGVCHDIKTGKFFAAIKVGKNKFTSKKFNTPEEAGQAYIALKIKHHPNYVISNLG